MGITDFFSNIKSKAIGALIEKQMKNLPPEQRELIKKLVEENPDLFKKISDETEALKKTGMNELYAGMMVMKKYEAQLAKAAAPHRTIVRKTERS